MTDPPALHCLRCGYDVRGLPTDGACPECGLGVGRSLQGQRELHRGRPAWINRLRVGAWLLLAVQVGLLAFIIVMFFGASLPLGAAGMTILFIALAVAHAGALLLLTGRENPFERRPAGNAVRILVRLGAANDAVLIVGLARLAWSPFTAASWWSAATATAAFALAPVWGLTFVHLRRLARRVLDGRLAEHCAIVAVGLPEAILGPFALFWSGAEIDRGKAGIIGLGLVLTALLVFVPWSAWLLGWFGVAFGRAARVARDSWAAADAAAGG